METVALAFEELGEASRPPLLILHGFFASSRNCNLSLNTSCIVLFLPDMSRNGQNLSSDVTV